MFLIALALLLIIASLVIYLRIWAMDRNKYWEKRNINFLKPKLFFGNSYEALFGRRNISEIHGAAYNAFPLDDMVGFFDCLFPQLILRKPELILKVMKDDFSHFTDRLVIEDQNPLSMNLINMSGNQWRAFRAKLSPIFSPGSLNYMYGSLSECGRNLSSLLDSKVEKEVDMKDIMELFSMDVIGSCAFGMDPTALQNPTSNFRTMGKKIFDLNAVQSIKTIIMTWLPTLAKKLNLSIFKRKTVQYYCQIILNTLEFRKKYGIERKDLIQLLMQLQCKGKIEVQSTDTVDNLVNNGKNQSETYEFPINNELLIGTAFGFLSAGLHTTASTLSYAIYELSLNPDVTERARTEIKNQVSIHGGINYDSLKCMIFLEKVLKETMRLHPAVPTIYRVCTKKYKFPNGQVVLPGDSIIIPISAIQRDPNYFTHPLNFNPDRFDEIPRSGTYLPFGEGPRVCIAMRFAILQMKFALSTILLNYNLQLSKNTVTPLKMSPRGFLNTPENEIIFRISKR